MQSKGAIQLFAILFALVCVYQLSFTWVVSGVEKDAKIISDNDPLQEQRYLDSIASELVYNILLKKYTYKECKDREINLGLDLKGGMNVTLEISVVDVIKALSNNSADKTFNQALVKAKEMEKMSDQDYVTLLGSAFQSIDPDAKLAAIFATRENQDRVKFNSTNEEVLKVIRTEAEGAIDRSFNILRARIDKFGVSQPNIQKLETSGRILVELPGVKEPQRVRELLQSTAKLEFWETYQNKELYSFLTEANTAIKDMQGGGGKTDSKTGKESLDTINGDIAAAAANDTSFSLLPATDSTDKKDTSKGLSLLDQLAAAKRDTAGSDTGVTDNQFADFADENPLFSVLRPALIQDEAGRYYPADGPVLGYVALKDTSKVNNYLGMKLVKSIFPRDLKFLWTAKPYDEEGKFVQLVAIKVTSREGRAPLEGSVIVDARQDYDQITRQPEVNMTMDAEGAKTWKRLTGENIGRSVAIVLDDAVYSFPTVQGEIPNGRSSISGSFTIKQAQDLANIVKVGKLPAPAHIVEEAIVGPSLGEEAIKSGLMSLIIAIIVVLLYMIFYYGRGGIVANVALISNIFFIMGVLASLGATLTLPGIAGIVLTIGMAVDANVLIFERVKEEVSSGKGIALAITDGYKNAYSSIIDSNVTTFLIGLILFYFGTGPIQGFATTLLIGIVTSLFSAIFITRLIYIWFLDKKKTLTFSTKLTEGLFKNLNIGFLQRKKVFYTISGIFIIAGIVSIFTKGLNYGVDFTGGRSYVVRFDKDVNTQNLRDQLTIVLGATPEAKTFGPSNQVKITTKFKIDDDSKQTDILVESKLKEGLSIVSDNFEIMSSQKVGPTIADDIKRGALYAAIAGLIVTFLYILLRFRKWQFGFGAVVALFHDSLLVLSCFSIFYGILPFSLEIDQAFIAALLTIIGYSINDTVVVFDRIREDIGIHKKKELSDIMNTALNATLGRTINTAMTTFFVVLITFIFGGEVIRGFSFALMIGIVVGTYSSLCIATPLALDTMKSQKPKP